jgi:hypothetical protein
MNRLVYMCVCTSTKFFGWISKYVHIYYLVHIPNINKFNEAEYPYVWNRQITIKLCNMKEA